MVDSNPRARWPLALQREFEEWQSSGVVGSVLVSACPPRPGS
jgi:hypothetical protein